MLRVGPRAGNAADIDKQLETAGPQQFHELLDCPDGMADKRHFCICALAALVILGARQDRRNGD